MSTRATVFTPELLDYLRRISEAEPPVLQRLRERTAGHRMGKWPSRPSRPPYSLGLSA